MNPRELVLRFWDEVINAHDPAAARALMSDDYRQHASGIAQGVEGFEAFLRETLDASEGMKAEVRGLLEVDDLVISSTVVRFDRPPPGWEPTNDLVDVFRHREGRLCEHWDLAPYS